MQTNAECLLYPLCLQSLVSTVLTSSKTHECVSHWLRWQLCRLMGKELFKTFAFISFICFTEEQKTMCKHKLKTAQRKINYIWSAVVLKEYMHISYISRYIGYIYSKNRNFPMGVPNDMRQGVFCCCCYFVCECVSCFFIFFPPWIHVMNRCNFTQQIN